MYATVLRFFTNRNDDAIFKVFKFLDTDGDGEVNRAEFCRDAQIRYEVSRR